MSFRTPCLAALATIAGLMMIQPAAASSSDAWAAFRADVQKKCLAEGGSLFKTANIAVDPVGSDRFGLAILWGKSNSTGDKVSMICIYDKQTRKVELGSEIGSDVVRIRKAKDGTDSGEE